MQSNRIFSLFVFSFAVMNAACSGGNGASSSPGGYGSMFDAPAGNATADRLNGLWGGSVEQGGVGFDFRIRVEDARITIASRCKWSDGLVLSVGASASSRTSSKPPGDVSCFPLDAGSKSECGEVDILESQSDRQASGDRWCAVDLHPRAYEWTMSGVKLRFTLQGQQIDLVKISD